MSPLIIDYIVLASATLFLHMTLGYLGCLLSKNMAIVDVFWASGITITGIVIAITKKLSGLELVIPIMTSIWGLRLALFLVFTRVAKGQHDKRYTRMQDRWGKAKHIKALINYYFQALLQVFLCTVYIPLFANLNNTLAPIQIVAIGLFIVAIIGEHIADMQLYEFKKNGNGICKTGLWRWSRHPNYFFEVLAWSAIALFSATSSFAYWSWVSPVSLYLIMKFITGAYTERLAVEKYTNSYKEYQQEVPFMVPFLYPLKKFLK